VISIIDYGAGNLRSVQNTLAELGAQYKLIDTPADVEAAGKLILPGVGHFGQLMAALDALRLRAPILNRIHAGTPFFGICLGMQALFAGSDEAPELTGLSLYPERVQRFPAEARVPHMGWNSLEPREGSRLLKGLEAPIYVYFANSYYAPLVGATSAVCDYQLPFTAAIEEGNVYGVQFHPEKSGPAGLKIVQNFLELA
jgi:imidazole glycerol phosphate synthase glutamine amidotransferase subunit